MNRAKTFLKQQKLNKMFDLVIYGATGFTGSLAVQYVSQQYGNSINWAIAGRSKGKLEAVLANHTATLKTAIPIILADSDDKRSLQKMCSQTSSIATSAGPFARYGTLLVECCAESGTHYCDITGETSWVRDMIANYDDKARKSGAMIVSLCGHDSIPWDLSTFLLAKKLKEFHNENLVSVDFYDVIKSAPSGGTLETAFGIMFGKEKGLKKSAAQKALGYDPLLKRADGSSSKAGMVVRNIAVLSTAG